jgi:hypothetical protein
MRPKTSYATTLLAAAAAAAGLIAAPTVLAAPSPPMKICVATPTGNRCQSPGNVEVKSPVPLVDLKPNGDMRFPLGGH